jgi:dynein heavy chain, axonemal
MANGWSAPLQVTSNSIAAKVEEAEKTEREIDTTRELYRPVAARASLLFFCISDLAAVDPMYQYSLSWFIALFIRGIEEAPKVPPCTCSRCRQKCFHAC